MTTVYVIEYIFTSGRAIAFPCLSYKMNNDKVIVADESMTEPEYIAFRKKYHEPLCAAYTVHKNNELVVSTLKDIVQVEL